MSNRQTWSVYGLIATLLISAVWGGWLVFTNPDMTHTRLLLTYWRHYLVMFALIGAAYWWSKREMRQ